MVNLSSGLVSPSAALKWAEAFVVFGAVFFLLAAVYVALLISRFRVSR